MIFQTGFGVFRSILVDLSFVENARGVQRGDFREEFIGEIAQRCFARRDIAMEQRQREKVELQVALQTDERLTFLEQASHRF